MTIWRASEGMFTPVVRLVMLILIKTALLSFNYLIVNQTLHVHKQILLIHISVCIQLY